MPILSNRAYVSFRRMRRIEQLDWHPADVIAALHKAGWSLRQIAFKHGVGESTIRTALRNSSPRSERLIAEILNLPVAAIWPERERLRTERRARKILKEPARDRVGA
jgi:Ner family transcriptional regulator